MLPVVPITTADMRDTIFISHATPEDNEFTIWLASRLELIGYKVWIDKKELLGGEVFWKDIETAITSNSIKFLLVYSKNICYADDPTQIKNGIQKEINFANQVIRDNPELIDFFTILHVDNSPFNLFPGSTDLNQIPFSDNWADGLSVLLKKLAKDCLPRNTNLISSNAADWYLEHYLIKNPIIEKKELYYTNWWKVKNLPDVFYILRFSNEKQAATIHKTNQTELIVCNANCIVSFKKNLDFNVITDVDTIEVRPDEIFEIKIVDVINGYDREIFPTCRDAENQLKKLLKRGCHNFFKERQFLWYDLANKNVAYYHTPVSLPSTKVNFTYPFSNNKKKKQLLGKYLTVGKWHFAMSVKPVLRPSVGFHLKSHIVFSKSGFKALEDKELQHAYRRKKGKRMFNEEWRDLLLGFINSLKNEDGVIQFKTSVDQFIVMEDMVEMFWSEVGYLDPKDLERQSLFTYTERDEEADEDEQS